MGKFGYVVIELKMQDKQINFFSFMKIIMDGQNRCTITYIGYCTAILSIY